MPKKYHKPEEIVSKLRQVDVLTSQGKPVALANALFYSNNVKHTALARHILSHK